MSQTLSPSILDRLLEPIGNTMSPDFAKELVEYRPLPTFRRGSMNWLTRAMRVSSRTPNGTSTTTSAGLPPYGNPAMEGTADTRQRHPRLMDATTRSLVRIARENAASIAAARSQTLQP